MCRRLKVLSFIIFTTVTNSFISGVELSPGYYGAVTMPFYTGSGFTSHYLDSHEADGFTNVKNNPKISMALGVSFGIYFTEKFAIQPEMVISSNGGGVSAESPAGNDYALLIDETTAEFPILFKRLFSVKSGHITLFGGPVFTVLVVPTVHKKRDGHDFSSEEISIRDFKRFGYGVEGGLGYEFPFKRGFLFMEGRYSYEFNDSIKNNGDFNQNCFYFINGFRFRW